MGIVATVRGLTLTGDGGDAEGCGAARLSPAMPTSVELTKTKLTELMELTELTVVQLKAPCMVAGVPDAGEKADLVADLVAAAGDIEAQ